MLLWTAGAALVHAVTILVVPSLPWISAVISMGLAVSCLALAQVAGRHTRLVGWGFNLLLAAVLSVFTAFGGGLEMGYALLMAVLCVSASLVLGWREGLAFGAWAMLLSVGVWLFGATDVMLVEGQDPDGVVISTHVIGLLVIVGLITYAVRHLYATLQESQTRRMELSDTLDALREARSASDRLVRSMGEPVWVTRPDLHVLLANDAALRLLGRSAEDVVGQPLTRWADLPDLADRRKRGEGRLVTVRGTIPVQISRAQAGTPDEPRFVFVATDLSRRVEAEMRIREAAEAAAEANLAKSHFLANISHELRTPLNAILGYSEMLLEERDSTDVQRIHRAGTHLLGLINDVLDMSKIEAGEMEVQAEDFGLDELLEECRETVAPLIAANGNQLDVPRTGLHLRSDRRKVAQVVLNLLSNGAKYTEDGRVWLDVEQRSQQVVISVHDTGRGIAVEDMPRLFQPFRQLGADAVIQAGTGLGLVLVKRLTELLGGRVEVRSSEGEGSTFTVVLPQLPDDGPLGGDVTVDESEGPRSA